MVRKYSVEVVVPIYNEELELFSSIVKLHSFLSRQITDFDWHITIADNASTDNSFRIGKKLARSKKNVSLLHLDQKGRGRAVKAAWQKSKADILTYMDVDLSTDLQAFHSLISALVNGADLAIGSRLLNRSKVNKRPFKREVLSRCYNILIKIFFFTRFSDAQCGFKGVTRKIAQKLVPKISDNAWFFDSELLITAEKIGYEIREIPVNWTDNPGSTVRVLKTVYGDLEGLWRLFWQRPWKKIKYD